MATKFEVTILGVNSAFPVHGRHPSCQVVNFKERLYMIDCGEAAQIQLAKFKIKRRKLDHIFISHMHGDHCYGLPGLLTSFALGGRSEPMSLHGPVGIKRFIHTILEESGAFLPYPLTIIEYDTETCQEISINTSLVVKTFPMKHRTPTMGFRFCELQNEKNINPDKIAEYNLSIDEIKSVKNGNDLKRGADTIINDHLTFPQLDPRSYSYCSDTVYDQELVPYIADSTLLYHETTYLDDLEELAVSRMHSTLGQAINIAKLANIKKLITGHYSSRYLETDIFLEQGLPLFDGLLLGAEGVTYTVE